MALKTFNPTSAGRRHLVQVDRSQLWKGKPVKSLVEGIAKNGGRGNTGRITTRGQGGGHKKSYRMVDFRRMKHDIAAVVEATLGALPVPRVEGVDDILALDATARQEAVRQAARRALAA